jgi:hypothetical protein
MFKLTRVNIMWLLLSILATLQPTTCTPNVVMLEELSPGMYLSPSHPQFNIIVAAVLIILRFTRNQFKSTLN